MKKIIYLFDDINYQSGAQRAMLLQMEALSGHFMVHAFSLCRPDSSAMPGGILQCGQDRPEDGIRLPYGQARSGYGISPYGDIPSHGQCKPEEGYGQAQPGGGIPILGDAAWGRTEDYARSLREVLRSGQIPKRRKLGRIGYSVLARLGRAGAHMERILAEEVGPLLENYDVVIVASEASKLRGLAAKLEKPRKIQWIHTDYAAWSGFSEWTRGITRGDRGIYQKFDRIVVLSESIRDGFLRKLPDLREKVSVIPNLIDGRRIQAKAEEALIVPLDRRKPNLLTVGRLDREKGCDRILDLCAWLQKEGCPFHWYLAGDGPLKGHLEGRIQREGLGGSVTLLGQCGNPYPLMKGCDWLVLLSEYEGTPVTIDEAMVLGTPVMAADVGGIREQLGRGGGNVLLEEGMEFQVIREKMSLKKRVPGIEYEKMNAMSLGKLRMLIDGEEVSVM